MPHAGVIVWECKVSHLNPTSIDSTDFFVKSSLGMTMTLLA